MKNILLKTFLAVILIIIISCNQSTQPPNPNQPPETEIANIPVEGDTIFALASLSWDGGDFDGYVEKYEYRYKTIRVSTGDSTVQEWKETFNTSETIPFISDDELNLQIFQVRSIDNNGTIDPSPAEKRFYTYRSVFPDASIQYPISGKTYFVSNTTSDWWEGIKVEYKAIDPDVNLGGGIVEYGYRVDNETEFTWTLDTVVTITPDRLSQPLSGTHRIEVTARDNTNLIDPTPAYVEINLVEPTFSKKYLIIDATRDNNFPGGLRTKPTDTMVDDFYNEIFPGADNYDIIKERKMPTAEIIGNYRAIIWHSDDLPSTDPHVIVDYTEEIKDYLNIGGKIIIGGWRILKSFAWDQSFPLVFEQGTFVNEYLHIVSVDETPLVPGDFIGAVGIGSQYEDIKVDSVKLLGFPFSGKLTQINLILIPGGFTDGIYSYQNLPTSNYFSYRGKLCGLRYYGTSFDAIVLGFPMYFIDKDSAKRMAQDIINHIGLN